MELTSKNGQIINLDEVSIVCNVDHKHAYTIATMVGKILEFNRVNFEIKKYSSKKKIKDFEFNKHATFVITVGGDGTLLASARFYSDFSTPVLGINAGRLGFLAQIEKKKLKFGWQQILEGHFKIDNRMMLNALTSIQKEKLSALNDIVIKGGVISRTSRLKMKLNNQEVCDYLADGIVISTPTGSTAYNLSANGPIIEPGLNTIAITPICPHTLSIRPLLIPGTDKIEIATQNDADLTYITADGQDNIKLKQGETILIKKSNKPAKLVLLSDNGNSFYSILREKLNWGTTKAKI